MVFHRSLSDSKSLKVSYTILNIYNTVVATCALISKSSSLLSNPLWIIPSAPITICVTVTFNSFCPQARCRYLSLFSLSFNFTPWSARTAVSTIHQVLSFVVIILFYSFGCFFRQHYLMAFFTSLQASGNEICP